MKFALCNELLREWSFERQVDFASGLGYDGLEIAPFTLADSVLEIPTAERARLRGILGEAGLAMPATHWLLVKPEGLHISSPDEILRKRTSDYLAALADFTADLGGSVMIFGSPKQRSLLPQVSLEQAREWSRETLLAALPACAERGVTLCIEQLSTAETDFLTTLEEVAEFVDYVDHPNCGLMLDVKAMSSLGVPLPELIRQYGPRAKHFHANDANLQGPGFGEVDYLPIFRILAEIGYEGWVSVEVFDYSPGVERLASESLRYLQKCLEEVATDG